MRAIILAAGVGKRLGEANPNNLPKCLLPFDGVTLLERHLRILHENQIDDVVLVLGHEHDTIQNQLLNLKGIISPRVIVNPDYTQGSAISLWCARDELRSGDDIILMDADVLYSSEMIGRLARTDISNCFLLDGDFEPGPEPVKLCVKDGVLVEFRKQLPEKLDYDKWGESVGFFRFSPEISIRLAEQLEAYVAADRVDEPHEEAIRDLLLEMPEQFGYEDVSGVPWIEIDFPQDVLRAKQDILPLI